MKITQICDNTWCFEEEIVRFFLLVGTEKALLIDSGMETKNAKELAESVTDLPIELINTHADGDHVASNEEFTSFYMHPLEAHNYFDLHGGKGTLVPVEEGTILDLGDRKVEIIALPGHTSGSIGILDLNTRMLFIGDTVQDSNIYMFGEERKLEPYMESLRHLMTYQDRFDGLYPSHGTCPLDASILPKLLDGAQKILSGEAVAEPVNIHGMDIHLYRFDYAGFYRP